MSHTAFSVPSMDKLIPLPSVMEGTQFLEVTYTLGADDPAAAYDWPLVGWDNTNSRLPVVAEVDGHLAVKQTASYPQQIVGGSNTFFVTRLVRNPLDVGQARRDLITMLRAALSAPQVAEQAAIENVTLPA